uniref:Uncharacterized protein n=3 Tax=Candidatus Kentrum sp. TUN TaxID=2126343 RepID=A0A451AJ76_9GAMM|nr:MAG: hypothetical protein BECKTUN1418D_GA0071000_14021 [Candidatus Kentron sp. TUN]VFK66088.1 MAG: hypothetical protein BECKTUN1418D_GA0071000_14292 [Candidatus Kentron sp. TUN]VFK66654.1 MAG: hypothetical protein BECKTUN1418D_GA0071000_15561 [Candidatus Kentron sp. TUN]VFK72828.1 MAG: hypothetical protein BECKTUN1418E_GA0071001_15081 [Candidatus Kentron sp. TUN]
MRGRAIVAGDQGARWCDTHVGAVTGKTATTLKMKGQCGKVAFRQAFWVT